MKSSKLLLFLAISVFLSSALISFNTKKALDDERILSYTVDPKTQNLKFYWKDDKGNILKSIGNLKAYLDKKKESLVFAMNGGMYQEDNSPLGLYIQEQKILHKLNTSSGNGNFYMMPNGVFYIKSDNTPVICKTSAYVYTKNIKYATQSGPMLVIDGKIHDAFKKGSSNLNIRNGVGILPDNKLVFAMSKKEINFYDFAEYFKNLGCKNALYLDGFVSRTYIPEKKWVQTDGNFGVMIGVTKPVL